MENTYITNSIPIFVSSTREDLIPYRDEVRDQIVRSNQIVKGMEYFGASSQRSLSVCLEQVRKSKLYIGVIGMRYGSIDRESGLSYTQLEYNEAIKCGIRVLIYIIDENHPIPPKYVDTGAKAKKLVKFKETLKKNHQVSFFTTPEDLGKRVYQDMNRELEQLLRSELSPKDDSVPKLNNPADTTDDFESKKATIHASSNPPHHELWRYSLALLDDDRETLEIVQGAITEIFSQESRYTVDIHTHFRTMSLIEQCNNSNIDVYVLDVARKAKHSDETKVQNYFGHDLLKLLVYERPNALVQSKFIFYSRIPRNLIRKEYGNAFDLVQDMRTRESYEKHEFPEIEYLNKKSKSPEDLAKCIKAYLDELYSREFGKRQM